MSDVEFGLIQPHWTTMASLCLHDEMVAVSEKSEASEKSVEKGSTMTKNLVVDFCFMIGDAIDAISSGDNRAREWTSHACYNGDVFSLGYLGVTWRLELGPEAKGNKMKGCAGKSNASVNFWGAQASNWQRWKHVDAKGGEADGKGTGKI